MVREKYSSLIKNLHLIEGGLIGFGVVPAMMHPSEVLGYSIAGSLMFFTGTSVVGPWFDRKNGPVWGIPGAVLGGALGGMSATGDYKGALMGGAIGLAEMGILLGGMYHLVTLGENQEKRRVAKRSLVNLVSSAVTSTLITMGIAGYNQTKDFNYLSGNYENLPTWRQLGESFPLK